MRIMKKLIKLLPLFGFALLLSGCASSSLNKQNTQAQQFSPLINFEPAINLSHGEVSENIQENVGSHVRWGGQVIQTDVVDESTIRLTVFVSPLGVNGRPVRAGQANDSAGRFIVELNEVFAQDVEFNGHFVTFYGEVTDQVRLTNGNKDKNIPLVEAIEFVDWSIADRQQYAQDRRGNAYYSLGYRTGHFYYPGRVGFSRFRGFSRYGYSSRYGNRSRFGYSSFRNRGFRRH